METTPLLIGLAGFALMFYGLMGIADHYGRLIGERLFGKRGS